MSTERNAESSITGVPAKGSVETFSHRSLRSFREPRQPRHRGLRSKMAMFVVALIAVLMGADALWNYSLQRTQAENEAREKAEVLASEMRAMWDFIDMNQDVINRDENGNFRTKTLVCVVAAKSVSTLFTSDTDYIIRFTGEIPRQNANAPDAFEQEAFDAFRSNPGLASYSGVRTDEETGQRVFRYTEPLYVTESCLECHGEPAGEIDQYGYPKEGMKVGDIGGAMSITEPMSIYEEGIAISVTQQALMVLIMVAVAGLGIFLAANRLLLRPIESLSRAAHDIEAGNFDYKLDTTPRVGGEDELSEFTRDFDSMARHLERLCTDLNSEVKKQTEETRVLNDMLMYQQHELKKALDKLHEESAYKSEFFAIVSHELRTPLTSILAFARLLLENPNLDEKTHESIADIEANGTLLLNLVNNILTISKAEANRNELLVEPVDFVDLLGFIKKTLDPIAANKDIALSAKADANVPISMADWEKLRRVIENLADNAIKYTHRGGRVDVRATFMAPLDPRAYDDGVFAGDEGELAYGDGSNVIARSDSRAGLDSARHDWEVPLPCSSAPHGTICVTVADDGMGIDESDISDIFELYKQAGQSPNRRYRGTGLGLAVVKELTELHGGVATVESQRKIGSTFCVRIPYVPLPDEEEDFDEDSAC